MTKNILKSDKLYRCKWFPKEDQKYKDLPCGKCLHLTEFIHCGIITDMPDQDCFTDSWRENRMNEIKKCKICCDHEIERYNEKSNYFDHDNTHIVMKCCHCGTKSMIIIPRIVEHGNKL